jgi:hypothetical protein
MLLVAMSVVVSSADAGTWPYFNRTCQCVMDIDGRHVYWPRHPSIYDPELVAETWLAPSFVAAVVSHASQPTVGAERRSTSPAAALFGGTVRVEAPGVFSFALLRPSLCAMLRDESARFVASGLPVHRPNSMNFHGIDLDAAGFRGSVRALQALTRPLMAALFADQAPAGGGGSGGGGGGSGGVGDEHREGDEAGGRGEGGLGLDAGAAPGDHRDAIGQSRDVLLALDDHHAFTVAYEPGADEELDAHEDDSEVTLNVLIGLGGRSEGGEGGEGGEGEREGGV